MARIKLKHKNSTRGDYPLKKGFSLTIGRQKKNDVVIGDRSVSGVHAKIDSVENGFVLLDLQSKNGTFVNEQLISAHWLKQGDVINIGEYALVFSHSESEPEADGETEDLEGTMFMDSSQYRSMMQKSNPTKSINVVRFWQRDQRRRTMENKISKGPIFSAAVPKKKVVGFLNYLDGGSGEIELTRHITTIGKHPSSDIIVRGFLVGQTAVTISKKPDGFYLCHVNGLSKPKVNAQTVKQPIRLNHLDIIEIKSVKLQFLNATTFK